MRMKCRRCGRTERYVDRLGNSRCAECSRAKEAAKYRDRPRFKRAEQLRQKYGLTIEQVDQMLSGQGGACAICRRTEPGGRWGTFVVDHCHKTGRVRGLLCDPCNRGIGFLKEDPERIRRAAHYLERT